MRRRGVPYVVKGLNQLFESPEIQAVVGIFRFVVGEIEEPDLKALWDDATLIPSGADWNKALKVLEVGRDFEARKRHSVYNIQRLFLDFIEALELREDTLPGDTIRGEIVFYQLGKFSQVISDYEQIHFTSKPKAKYEGFAKWHGSGAKIASATTHSRHVIASARIRDPDAGPNPSTPGVNTLLTPKDRQQLQGRIYISGAFEKVSPPQSKDDWRDNCPHFWSDPPTWGICRFDFRASLGPGDYVFFVLPSKSALPQMIYGYLKIEEIISHFDAYHRPNLTAKRMGNKNPNGNIIVDATGSYNRFDGGQHQPNFEKIKEHYAIGSVEGSKFLTEGRIVAKAPGFQTALNSVFSTPKASTPIGVISRKGRVMTDAQVAQLLDWVRT